MTKARKSEKDKVIKRFIHYYKKYRGVFFLDLFCASLTVVCEMALPMLVRYLTNIVITDIESLTVNIILIVGSLYMGLKLIDVVGNYYKLNQGHVMGAMMENDMRRDLFNHLSLLSFDYYDSTKVGQLTSRITTDLFDITEVAHHCPEEFYIAGLKMIISFSILSQFSLTLTLILFAIIPFMIIAGYAFKKRMQSVFMRRRRVGGEINAQVEDTLLGIRIVKSFEGENTELAKFEKNNESFLDVRKDTYKCMGRFITVVSLFEGAMYVVCIVLGGVFMLNGEITAPDFVAYLLYVTTLLATVRTIIQYLEQFQNGVSSIRRFYEVMDVEPTIVGGDVSLERARGDIKFEDVTFSYNEGQDVLSDINLHIKEGERVAIVGPSGSGKSTLVNLIPRFYDVNAGRVLIDDIDIHTLTLHSLRQNIGMVQQEVYLFSGTVSENIAYGKENATHEEIVEAARRAGAHDFIMSLPDGYDTYVGERGVKLSGGQKQRISLARVFLKDPPILILDEATSALDNESEKVIEQSLDILSENRTTITIAHRLTTVRNVDRILVLTGDGIVEEGSHEELMRLGGIYYDMYSMYLE